MDFSRLQIGRIICAFFSRILVLSRWPTLALIVLLPGAAAALTAFSVVSFEPSLAPIPAGKAKPGQQRQAARSRQLRESSSGAARSAATCVDTCGFVAARSFVWVIQGRDLINPFVKASLEPDLFIPDFEDSLSISTPSDTGEYLCRNLIDPFDKGKFLSDIIDPF